MNKNSFLVSLVFVLGMVYIYFFTGLFTKFAIRIDPRPRPLARGAKAAVYPVAFALDQRYLLTSIKVVPLVSNTFNRFTVPILHLTSKSNSVPVNGFIYGEPIKGMELADPKARIGALQPNVVYRLFLEAKGRKGQVDFRAPVVRN